MPIRTNIASINNRNLLNLVIKKNNIVNQIFQIDEEKLQNEGMKIRQTSKKIFPIRVHSRIVTETIKTERNNSNYLSIVELGVNVNRSEPSQKV
jgi:hypothetical protein